MTIANNIESNSSIYSHKKPHVYQPNPDLPGWSEPLRGPICWFQSVCVYNYIYIYVHTHTIYIYVYYIYMCIYTHTSVDNIHFELDFTWINWNQSRVSQHVPIIKTPVARRLLPQHSPVGWKITGSAPWELVCPTNNRINGVPGAFSRRLQTILTSKFPDVQLKNLSLQSKNVVKTRLPGEIAK